MYTLLADMENALAMSTAVWRRDRQGSSDTGRLAKSREYLKKFPDLVPDERDVAALFEERILWDEVRREIERPEAKP